MPDKPKPNRVVSAQRTPEDESLATKLRPRKLADFVGQQGVKENLEISLQATQTRGEALDHVLLHGPPGLGKTTLAHIIANEMEVNLVGSSGPALERPGDLVGILTNLQSRDVFFIDEIHRLPRPVEEYLYSAMEEFEISYVTDSGPYAKTIKFPLKPFTLVGATTRAGLLTAPLRERFGILHHVDFYPEDEILQIVKRSAQILGVEIRPQGAQEIACRSRGTPRIANRLLRRVRDYADVKAEGVITQEVADQALQMLQVDKLGLDSLDRKLLRTIIDYYHGGPVGIEALAATLSEESDTLVDMVEPFLLKIGFLTRTPSGRKATELAYQHFGLIPPAGTQGNLPLSQAPDQQEQ